MEFWAKAGFKIKQSAPPRGRPLKKETRGRKSKATRIEEDEPLCHVQPAPQPAAATQQQVVKVKATRMNWSLAENQKRLKKAIDDWKAQEEKVRM